MHDSLATGRARHARRVSVSHNACQHSRVFS